MKKILYVDKEDRRKENHFKQNNNNTIGSRRPNTMEKQSK